MPDAITNCPECGQPFWEYAGCDFCGYLPPLKDDNMDMDDETTPPATDANPEPFREDQVNPQTGEITSASPSLMEAIHKVVTDLPVWIKKDATATVSNTRKQKYATMKAIMEVVRPIALRHGIRIRQNCEHAWQLDTTAARGRMIPVYTELILSSTGERERTTVEIPLGNLDAQGMGAAITYGRRYCLLMAFSLTTDDQIDDDDGEATKQRPNILREHVDSVALMGFRDEIDSFDDIMKLIEWGRKVADGKRTDVLDDIEAALLRAYFKSALIRLRDTPAEETPPKKK